jgi:hypothetical protein
MDHVLKEHIVSAEGIDASLTVRSTHQKDTEQLCRRLWTFRADDFGK